MFVDVMLYIVCFSAYKLFFVFLFACCGVVFWYFDNVACSARPECSVFSYVSQVASVWKIQFLVTVPVV